MDTDASSVSRDVDVPGPVAVRMEISQSKYLSAAKGEQEMHAILTVRVDGTEGGAGAGPLLAQILAVDCSSSMDFPEEKLRAARRAAVAALRILPDGTPFAVIRGAETAAVAYPPDGAMVRADARRRAEAEEAVYRLVAAGGTCMGAWLELSCQLLEEQDAPIGHVLLLTDGKNQHDALKPLDGVLGKCAGRFVCDAWGIGDGWDGRELLKITRHLHGSAGSVREASALREEYEKLMHRLLTKSVPELVISVTPEDGAAVRYVKQVFPAEAELASGGGQDGGPQRFVTRAWGDETRRYQLCLSADPAGREPGKDLPLALVAVEVPGGEGVRLPMPLACVVHWTDDPALSRYTDVQVGHFERHQLLGEAIAAATDAHRNGEHDLAERKLGQAVRLAHGMGGAGPLGRLERLVEIVDAVEGRVRMRPGVAAVDFEHLITASSHSTYGPASAPGCGTAPAGPAGGTMPCPACEKKAPVTARFCPSCRHRFGERP